VLEAEAWGYGKVEQLVRAKGIVRANNQPVSGAQVRLTVDYPEGTQTYTATTDGQGKFDLGLVKWFWDGELRVTASGYSEWVSWVDAHQFAYSLEGVTVNLSTSTTPPSPPPSPDFGERKRGTEPVILASGAVSFTLGSNETKSVDVELASKVTELSVTPSEIRLGVGGEVEVAVQWKIEEEEIAPNLIRLVLGPLSGGKVRWQIADSNIASLSAESGLSVTVRGLREGQTTLTVTDTESGKSKQVRVQVSQTKQWTVLVYQAGDNDLEDALIKDFNEMERVGSDDNINIVVQLDRSPRYDTSNGNWSTTRRYYITRDPEEPFPPDFSTRPNNTIRSQLLEDLGKVNMGDENVLRDFLLWGIQNFPAQHYFVILSNHGAGVRPFRRKTLLGRGMLFTDTFNDYISEDESKRAFAAAVQALGRPIDIIGIDCSEMSEIEIAYQLRDACRYLIASQLSEPNDGYPYDRFLWELHQKPTMSTEDFLQRFVQHYIASYQRGQPTNGAGSSVTIAVYNQSVVPTYVQQVDALAQVLLSKLPQYRQQFVNLRNQTQSFSESIYRDLYHYCQLLVQNINDQQIRQAAQNVMNWQGPGEGKALLYEAHATGFDIDVGNAHGIAIYFPDPASFDSRYLNANDFARTTKWGLFLQQSSSSSGESP
jgi:hypothetical protein